MADTAAVLRAQQDYNNYLNPDQVDTDDPMRMVAQVMLGLSNSQADLLRAMTVNVRKLTDKMSDINALMSKLNNALSTSQIDDDQHPGVIQTTTGTTLADRQAIMATVQALIDNTATTAFSPPPDVNATWTSGTNVGQNLAVRLKGTAPNQSYELYAFKTPLTNMNQVLQRNVDQASSEVQQAQLDLQTLMGRYNGSFEVVTAAIKKDETQAQSVTSNVRK